jgi:hypothetical protein
LSKKNKKWDKNSCSNGKNMGKDNEREIKIKILLRITTKCIS